MECLSSLMSTGSKSSGSKVEKVEEKARQKESWERPHPTENSGCGLQDRADEQRGQLVAELVVLLVLFFDAWKFGGGPSQRPNRSWKEAETARDARACRDIDIDASCFVCRLYVFPHYVALTFALP